MSAMRNPQFQKDTVSWEILWTVDLMGCVILTKLLTKIKINRLQNVLIIILDKFKNVPRVFTTSVLCLTMKFVHKHLHVKQKKVLFSVILEYCSSLWLLKTTARFRVRYIDLKFTWMRFMIFKNKKWYYFTTKKSRTFCISLVFFTKFICHFLDKFVFFDLYHRLFHVE